MAEAKLLIKQVKVVDPASPHNGKKVDILFGDDQVLKIAEKLEDNSAEVISHPNLHISPGWFDLRVNFHDPGHEEREDIDSGIRAAIAGGFTGVGLSPETSPCIDSKADVEYIYQRAESYPVNIFPYGAISKGLEGKELSEMYDMYQAGAVAFSNGKKPISNTALARLALQYTREFAPPLHFFPNEESLLKNAQMHEGAVSTFLGLKGIPVLAEEISLQRDLYLANYAETSVHFNGISSREGLMLLKNAHAEGRSFTADVSINNLIFTDQDLDGYDSKLKLLPPVRTEEDRMALIEALNEDLIQVVTSDHDPVDPEGKNCEFDHALFGAIGLQSLFGAMGTLREHIELERCIELIAINPRRVLALEVPVISEGNWAEFTLFDPDEEWQFEAEMIESKSKNSPFISHKLKGKALGILNKGILVWMGEGA